MLVQFRTMIATTTLRMERMTSQDMGLRRLQHCLQPLQEVAEEEVEEGEGEGEGPLGGEEEEGLCLPPSLALSSKPCWPGW